MGTITRTASHLTAGQRELLRRRLSRRAQVLVAEIAASLHSGALSIAADERETQDVEASVAAAEAQRDSRELREIEAALERMQARTYGLCARCGAPIPWARLDALPEAQACADCETGMERGQAAPALL